MTACEQDPLESLNYMPGDAHRGSSLWGPPQRKVTTGDRETRRESAGPYSTIASSLRRSPARAVTLLPIVLMFAAVETVADAAAPLLCKRILDSNPARPELPGLWLALVCSGLALSLIASYQRRQLAARCKRIFVFTLQRLIVWTGRRLSYQTAVSMPPGTLDSRALDDMRALAPAIDLGLGVFRAGVVAAVVLVLLNGQLSLLLLAAVLGSYTLVLPFALRVRRYYEHACEAHAGLSRRLWADLRENVATVGLQRLFVRSRAEVNNLFHKHRGRIEHKKRITSVGATYRGIIGAWNALISIAAFLYLGSQYASGLLTLGTFAAAVILTNTLSSVCVTLYQSMVNSLESTARLRLPVSVLALRPQPESASVRPPRLNGDLELCAASFWYHEHIPVLRSVSFAVKAGDRVLLKGPSGSGKTTVLSLLNGTQSPNIGRVLVDGRDCTMYSGTWLRQRIRLVDHCAPVLRSTLRENITLGAPEIPDAEVAFVAEMVGLGPWMQTIENSLSTRLQPGSVSGGQRQRIALARAIATRPDVLLLDEATDCLDLRSEACLFGRLLEYLSGCTIVLVTHRDSLDSFCHRRMNLSDGLLTETAL